MLKSKLSTFFFIWMVEKLYQTSINHISAPTDTLLKFLRVLKLWSTPHLLLFAGRHRRGCLHHPALGHREMPGRRSLAGPEPRRVWPEQQAPAVEVGLRSPPVPRGHSPVPGAQRGQQDAVAGGLRLQHYAVVALPGRTGVHQLRDDPGRRRRQGPGDD